MAPFLLPVSFAGADQNMKALLKIGFVLAAGAVVGALLTAEGRPMIGEAVATALSVVTLAAFWSARGAEV